MPTMARSPIGPLKFSGPSPLTPLTRISMVTTVVRTSRMTVMNIRRSSLMSSSRSMYLSSSFSSSFLFRAYIL